MFTLVYRVHRILVAASKGKLVIPYGVDREAVHRFVDEVFFATQFLGEDTHSEAKARASRPDAAPSSSATGAPIAPETTDGGNDACRPNSGAGGKSPSTRGVQARRIAGALVKLHKAGAIKSEQDASARLVRDSGASFIVHVGPNVPKPGAPNGFMVPEAGKPYMPTAAQRVKIPRGLSRI